MEIDLDNKLREIPSFQPIFLSNNDYSDKPSNTRDEFPFEVPYSTKATFLNNQDFHHLENDPQFHPDWSSQNPISGVQTGSNFDSLDAFPYGSISTNMDFYDYDIKPFGDINHHHHQVIMDDFQTEGGYLNLPIPLHRNHPIEMVGSNQGIINNHQGDMFLNFQGVKPVNLVAPDELSCVTANKDYYKIKVGMSHKINDGSSNNNRGMTSTKRTHGKNRKKSTVVKGQWTAEEDRLLVQLVQKHGIRKWSHIAPMLPGRIGKQCRERWHNHLRPDIKKDTWSEEEDRVLIQAHAELGNKWAEIAKRLPGRTENSIKNHWNATKRRQYSKRKCRSKYPRGSLLQDYIKSLNLDSPTTTTTTTTTIGRVQDRKASAVANGNMGSNNNSNTIVHSMVKVPSQHSNEMDPCFNDRLVPSFDDFNEVHDFDEKMFQEGFCNIDTLLDDEIPCAPVFDETNFCVDDVPVEDVAPMLMDVEAKKKSS